MPHAEPYPPFPDNLPTAPLLIIDWNKLDDAEEKERLFEAFATAGFCYLANIPVDPSEMFDLSPQFFALPLEEKMKYPMGTTVSATDS
jgi:isopenicillin N synthase-like dioxygenase